MPITNLVDELILVFTFECAKPVVICTKFEDNQSAISVAKAPSIPPCAKHTTLEYYHFRPHAQQGLADAQCARSEDQIPDAFNKPLVSKTFSCLRCELMGW